MASSDASVPLANRHAHRWAAYWHMGAHGAWRRNTWRHMRDVLSCASWANRHAHGGQRTGAQKRGKAPSGVVLGTTGVSAMWQSNSSMGFLVRCKDWGWSGRLRLAPGGICAAHRQHLRRFPVSVARAPPDHPDHGLHPSPEGVGPITAVHPPVELQRLLGIKVDHIRHAGVAVAPSDWPRLVDWLRAHSPTGAEGAIAGLARRQGQREAAGRLLPPRDGTGGPPTSHRATPGTRRCSIHPLWSRDAASTESLLPATRWGLASPGSGPVGTDLV